jgi:hypothetical protein
LVVNKITAPPRGVDDQRSRACHDTISGSLKKREAPELAGSPAHKTVNDAYGTAARQYARAKLPRQMAGYLDLSQEVSSG